MLVASLENEQVPLIRRRMRGKTRFDNLHPIFKMSTPLALPVDPLFHYFLPKYDVPITFSTVSCDFAQIWAPKKIVRKFSLLAPASRPFAPAWERQRRACAAGRARPSMPPLGGRSHFSLWFSTMPYLPRRVGRAQPRVRKFSSLAPGLPQGASAPCLEQGSARWLPYSPGTLRF
jgi:hypothetical protein